MKGLLWWPTGMLMFCKARSAALPPTWSAVPAGRASVKVGSAWLASLRSPILLVPSVVVPEERAALVNPLHPDCRKITARALRLFEYNRLFRAS